MHSDTPAAARWSLAGVGCWVGPLLAAAVWLAPGAAWGLTPAAQATLAITLWMAVWWMTEAIPLAATALLPIVLLPPAGVASLKEAAAPFAEPTIFLFLGGFLIALAIERWGLHRRIALTIVAAAGVQPARLVGAFMLATALLSMWISNTATTLMMLPIAASVAHLLAQRWRLGADAGHAGPPATERDIAHLGASLMLGIAYAASIGGVATLIGTPPNALLRGFMEQDGLPLSFGRWMLLATPLAAVFLLLAWLVLTRWLFPVRVTSLPGGHEVVARELAALGPMSRGEWTVLLVFLATALAWITREFWDEALLSWLLPAAAEPGGGDMAAGEPPPARRLDDAWIALIGALALFLIPVDRHRGERALDWKIAGKIPYDVLLLFGGGFSLAEAIKVSGLGAWICQGVVDLPDVPPWVFVVVVTAAIVLLTEVTSNAATTTLFVPLLLAAARQLADEGRPIDPYLLLPAAALAASCAFMLPVATPPNAIVYGSGLVTMGQMARAGVWLNLLSIVLIPLFLGLLARWTIAPG